MAKLVNLADELLLSIARFIPNLYDILHLTRSCRYLYRMTIPFLYERLRFKVRSRAICPDTYSWDYTPPTDLTIHRLCHYLAQPNNEYKCRQIRSVELVVDPNTREDELEDLFERASALQELRIEIEAPRRLSSGIVTTLSCAMAHSLRSVSETLKSLTLYVEPKFLSEYTWPSFIGDLDHFISLERFELQTELLLNDVQFRESLMGKRWNLPLQLKELRLRSCVIDAPEAFFMDWAEYYELPPREGWLYILLGPLTVFLSEECSGTLSLRKVVLWLPKEHKGVPLATMQSELDDFTKALGLRGVEVDARIVGPYPGSTTDL